MNYVLAYVLNHDAPATFLAVLKRKPDWQNGYYNLPGGKYEPQDEGLPVRAAHREVVEETGLPHQCFTPVSVLGEVHGPGWKIDVVRFDYFHLGLSQVPTPEEGTGEEPRWLHESWLKTLPVIPNLKVIVPLCQLGIPFKICDGLEDATTKPHSMIVTLL